MTPDEIREIEQYAASGQPVTAEAAQGVIRLFDLLARHRSTASFVPLDPNERLALACRAAQWPEERLAGMLRAAEPAVRPLLLGTLGKLAHNLGPGGGDNRSGDRAPGPRPRGGPPSLAVTKPLPRDDQTEARQRGEWLVRVVPVDWNGEGSEAS
ncbi:MAG TPA: hypothetical protein VKV26_18970 [Dehalococcoidia bacterium]|nr:hypothetical protein [Dehalococcoidia bacterium]